MKPKVVSLVLSFAALISFSSSANARPSNSQIVNNAARSFCCLNDWRFNSLKQDFGSFPYILQQASDWKQIAILSKPYRSNSVVSANTAKPFSLWQFNSIAQDLGISYNQQQATDWNRLATLTKPYRR